nr:carbohydrate porin [Parabacteroides sp. FAFU027]
MKLYDLMMNGRSYLLVIFTWVMSIYSLSANENIELKDSPFSLQGVYTGDAVANLSGGIKTGTAYLGMANLRVGFDAEKAKLWKGGSFYANLANTHGDTPSETLIGDFQVASNIEAGDHTYIQELWYAQQIGHVKVTLGLQDLNVEMANSEHGALYRNSSFGIHSTISDNVPAPVFPLTSPGVTISWDFLPKWNWHTAVYDGTPLDFDRNPHNLVWNFTSQDGVLVVNELEREDIIKSLPHGMYKVGSYFHDHKLTAEEEAEGLSGINYGFYGVADQMIWAKKDHQGVSIFAQGSFSPKLQNDHSYYCGGGINCYGIGKREKDIAGIALAHAGFRDKKKEETIIELTYKAALGENFYLQPNFQYIIHPAGTDEVQKNATVAALRFGLNF